MIGRQARRARFAHRAKMRRVSDRIMKQNSDKPGFLGVVLNMKMDGGRRIGHCAVFINRTVVE